jgi:hypothetical protein
MLTSFPDGTIELRYDVGDFLPFSAPRWKATITYRTLSGTFSKVVLIDELDELADIVEDGPNFYSITDIQVVPNARVAQAVEVLN